MKLPVRSSAGAEATGAPRLDIVVLHTTTALTCRAMAAANRLSADLHPLTRIVRLEEVPFPLPLDSPAVTSDCLRRDVEQVASRSGAHVQICFCREARLALLQLISCRSVVVIATERRWFHFLRRTREERLARWLRSAGYSVVLEYASRSQVNNHAS